MYFYPVFVKITQLSSPVKILKCTSSYRTLLFYRSTYLQSLLKNLILFIYVTVNPRPETFCGTDLLFNLKGGQNIQKMASTFSPHINSILFNKQNLQVKVRVTIQCEHFNPQTSQKFPKSRL